MTTDISELAADAFAVTLKLQPTMGTNNCHIKLEQNTFCSTWQLVKNYQGQNDGKVIAHLYGPRSWVKKSGQMACTQQVDSKFQL